MEAWHMVTWDDVSGEVTPYIIMHEDDGLSNGDCTLAVLKDFDLQNDNTVNLIDTYMNDGNEPWGRLIGETSVRHDGGVIQRSAVVQSDYGHRWHMMVW